MFSGGTSCKRVMSSKAWRANCENKDQGVSSETQSYSGSSCKYGRVRRETIVFLEKGKYNPSLKLAYRVSRYLDTTIDELFIFEDSDLE